MRALYSEPCRESPDAAYACQHACTRLESYFIRPAWPAPINYPVLFPRSIEEFHDISAGQMLQSPFDIVFEDVSPIAT